MSDDVFLMGEQVGIEKGQAERNALQSRIDELEAKLGDRAMYLTEWAERLDAFVTMVSKETLIHDGEYSYLNPYQAEAKRLILNQSDVNTDKVYAPWSEEQIDALEKWQMDDTKHPYTCICGESLMPYKDGWICDECGHKQNWYIKGLPDVNTEGE